MTAPIPRPPGLWHALGRDGCLNPEEAAARAVVISAHTAAEPPEAEPAPAPPEDVDATPERRLSAYQALGDRAGWKLAFDRDADRGRLEAFHPDGAAIMVIAVRGQKTTAFVLPARQKRMPRWRDVDPADLEAFFVRRQVVGPKTPTSSCTCGKRPYPTEARAKAAIVDVTIVRVVKRHGLQSERRAYRCPDDDLIWHLTSIEKWYGNKKPKHQKEAKS